MTAYDYLASNSSSEALSELRLDNIQPIRADGLYEVAYHSGSGGGMHNDMVAVPNFRLPFERTFIEVEGTKPELVNLARFKFDWVGSILSRMSLKVFLNELYMIAEAKSCHALNRHCAAFLLSLAVQIDKQRGDRDDPLQSIVGVHDNCITCMSYGIDTNRVLPLGIAIIILDSEDMPIRIFTLNNSLIMRHGETVSDHSIALIKLINIIHSRQVELVEREAEPQGRRERRRKIIGRKSLTIEIAGKDTYTKYKSMSRGDAENAQHYCRGHFAYYSEDKPLFGNPKLVGRFWKPAHLKGRNKEAFNQHTYVTKESEEVSNEH